MESSVSKVRYIPRQHLAPSARVVCCEVVMYKLSETRAPPLSHPRAVSPSLSPLNQITGCQQSAQSVQLVLILNTVPDKNKNWDDAVTTSVVFSRISVRWVPYSGVTETQPIILSIYPPPPFSSGNLLSWSSKVGSFCFKFCNLVSESLVSQRKRKCSSIIRFNHVVRIFLLELLPAVWHLSFL